AIFRSSAQARMLIFRVLIISNVLLPVSLGLDPLCVGPFITVCHHIFMMFKPMNIKVDIVLILGEVAAGLLILIAYDGFTFPLTIVGSLSSDFFNGCDISGLKSDYTPWRTIFGYQPLAPLGESRVIIAIRTCVLIGLTFGIPAFGVYVMFLVPITAQTMTRDIKVSQSWSSNSEWPADQNITILFVCNTSGILTHLSKLLRRAALRQMPASLGSG
ncbi:hypothetical protein B0H14DRAFT_2758594, partial [Mycena olivaceomarginata]